ncbi:MAG: MATE family efflux transporter [Bacteroidales bacterium]|nr:MATE family efflux transporter [Bacteroidales bacterium]MCF8455639.1 MATE family efflux transporter [Bacteroidales bacterium]
MNKKILDLAIPNIISNITIPLLGIVDLAIVGRMGSEMYIGGIALGGMIFNFIYWGFGFLRMGTSGFTAQAYGSQNHKESILLLSRALFVAFIGGIGLVLLQVPIERFSFFLIDGGSEVEALASEYFYIRIFAAPATICLYALTGWFLGMQNARYPMIIAIVINLLNVGFNFMFVYGFGMKSAGVAWGTLLAQYAGFFLGLFLLMKKYRHLFPLWNYQLMIQWEALKIFFLVNRDIFIRTLCLMFVFTYFTSKSAGTDDIVLAVNTLLLQFFFIFSYLIDGFAYAAEALVGKYIGEKNKADLRQSIKLLFVWGVIISLPFSAIYFLAGDYLLMLLTNNRDLIIYAKEFMPWVVAIPIVSFVSFLWDGIYIGATASKAMRNTMLVATLVFFPVAMLFNPVLGNHSLWLAMVLFLAGRGISQTIIAPKAIYSKI